MNLYQHRVVVEKRELDQKRAALAAFIGTDAWDGLPVAEQLRLQRQLDVMGHYSDILGERIDAFPK